LLSATHQNAILQNESIVKSNEQSAKQPQLLTNVVQNVHRQRSHTLADSQSSTLLITMLF